MRTRASRENWCSKRTVKSTLRFVYVTQILSFVSGLIGKYFQVTKMLGNGRLEAMCFDGVKRLCHIRGKLRKKVILLPDVRYGLLNCTVLFRRFGSTSLTSSWWVSVTIKMPRRTLSRSTLRMKPGTSSLMESSLSPSRSMRRSTLLAEIWMTTSSSMMSTAMTPAVTTPMTLMEFNLLICPFSVAF